VKSAFACRRAQRGKVYGLVMREAGGLIGIGLAAGLVGSFGAGSLIRSLLFATNAWDVLTLTSVAVTLGISALMASFLPAHRAPCVNPVEALHPK
jgi:macrolide transport system ATP-binding/permease protein